MEKFVCLGRGGVGKTTFIALLARCFKKRAPLLLIDADPDQSLSRLVGIDLEKEKIKTVSDILFEVRFGNIDQRTKSFPLVERIDYLLRQDGLYESDFFDFLSLGTKWTEGCYCQPNNTLKELIKKLEKNYNYTLIDSPAGLEHLNRRVTSKVDKIFAIIDPSLKAFENIKRAYKIIKEIKIEFNDFYVVANHRFPEDLLSLVEKKTGLKYVGKLEYDQDVEKLDFEGKSLFTLKENSPLFTSVKKIAEITGC